MKIKSLLIGSAAALAVVSGARAADAVVAAEPEPMEYVKVCDAYGTGYFYIPGTETCLKVGGQLRYELRASKVSGSGVNYDNHARARLNIEAKNDSEWGTVYSWIRIQGDQTDNEEATSMKTYFIFGIGGLEFSNWDSQWAKFFDYGGFTDDGGIYDNSWDFPDSRQYVSYTADFGAFKAYVSLDNDNDEYKMTDANGKRVGEEHFPGGDPADRGHKYMPDVTAGVSGTFADWTVAGGVAYDESDESFAAKTLVAGKFGMIGVRLMGLYSDSRENIYFNYNGLSGILGLSAQVTETVSLANDIQVWDNGDWRVVGNVNWEVASGFSVLVEGIYADRFDAKTKSGMLRFQRSF
jgi:hypothetical protein